MTDPNNDDDFFDDDFWNDEDGEDNEEAKNEDGKVFEEEAEEQEEDEEGYAVIQQIDDEDVIRRPEPEMSAGKKGKKGLIAGLAALFVLIAAAGSFFGYTMWAKSQMSYALTLNGEKVSIEEYKLFVLFQDPSGDVRTGAVASLVESLILEKAAKENNLSLSPDEKAGIDEDVQMLKSTITSYGYEVPVIDDERFAEILSVNAYFEKFIEKYSSEHEVDEDVLNEAFTDYRDNYSYDYIKTSLKYVLTYDEETAAEAREAILSGRGIDDVIMEYSASYDPSYGIETVSLNDVPLDGSDYDSVLALDFNEPSEVIFFDEFYAVFVMHDKYIPTEDELYETFKSDFIMNEAYMTFNNELTRWLEEAEYTLNEEAMSAVDGL